MNSCAQLDSASERGAAERKGKKREVANVLKGERREEKQKFVLLSDSKKGERKDNELRARRSTSRGLGSLGLGQAGPRGLVVQPRSTALRGRILFSRVIAVSCGIYVQRGTSPAVHGSGGNRRVRLLGADFSLRPRRSTFEILEESV